jgi:hypothetical protein
MSEALSLGEGMLFFSCIGFIEVLTIVSRVNCQHKKDLV